MYMFFVLQDLGTKDILAQGMHLICQIVRKGKMLPDDRKNIHFVVCTRVAS